MAFKSRNKDNGIEIFVDNADSLNVNTSKEKQNYSIPVERSFKEQSIRVINILASRGIDIYDENRTPGMYLDRNEKLSNSKNIKSFLGGLSTQDNQHEQQITQKDIKSNTPNSVFDFLNNIK